MTDYLSLDDYLRGEHDAPTRHEYLDGQAYAMVGASERHNTIAQTLGSAIDNVLHEDCRVWQSDMKVVGKHAGKPFAYCADGVFLCGRSFYFGISRFDPASSTSLPAGT